jgi:tetratricopeptide (TPR) repeat protein
MANRVGEQLGNYRLTQLLGQGGFAEVYLGEHVYLNTSAALKVLDTELSEQDADSFVQEAQTLAHLSHPHIVRVLDFAVEDGTPFLVIEYAPNGTLRNLHPKGTRLPLETIVLYVQQIAAALQYAHDQRLIHRDVKPENLLLNERFDILLSDFGLGMFARHTLSQSIQQIAGTAFYIAPEQIQGKPRPASDQYALGIVVYEWLTGDCPFGGPLTQIVTQHLAAPPPSLRERVPTLPQAVEEVVMRALAKEPKQRFARVQDFATALRYAAQGTTPPHYTLPPTLIAKAEPASLSPTLPAERAQGRFETGNVPTYVPLTPGREQQDTLQESAKIEHGWQAPDRPAALIGRKAEWIQLVDTWQRASAGQPHLLVLSGDVGIGKTHLAEELLTGVGRQGIATAIARCYAVEGELAYMPVVAWLRAEALRPALAVLDAVWLTEVARLLPDLLRERPDLPHPSPLQEDWQRQRLFEALARALLIRGGPLLLLLDDLQWCDRETLALVHYLLRFDPKARLLIVGTLRAEELTKEHSLQSWLASLRREGQLTEINLERLTAAESTSLAAQLSGRELDAEVTNRLYQDTEGNALFVVETVRLGLEAAEEREQQDPSSAEPKEQGAAQQRRLPPTIHAVITARLEQLSPRARELVSVAAIIGRAFSFEVLTAASGWNDEAVVEALDELGERRIIREQGSDNYDFSHDKLRKGAYTSLSRARRRLLHRRVADSMERFSGSSLPGRLTDLAYHYYEAGSWEQALRYGQRAGEQEQAMYAPRAAVEQFTRALDAAQKGSIPPPALLYHLRGQAYQTLGDFERARPDYETSLQLARDADDHQGEWQALMDLSFLWAERDYIKMGAYCQQALALARGMDDPITLAHTLSRRGNWLVNIEQPLESLRYHQEALTIFQGLQDQHGIAETLDLLGMASYLGGDLVQGTDYYHQAIALFRELDDRHGLTSSLATLAIRGPTFQTDTMVAASTNVAELIQETHEALVIARTIDQRPAEAYALFQLALCLGSVGDYGRALTTAQQSLRIAEEIEHRQWQTAAHTVLGGIYSGILAYPQAREHFERALVVAREIGSLVWTRIVTGYLASALIAHGDLSQAQQVLRTELDPRTPTHTMAQRLMWCAQVELALAQGQPARALEMTDALITSDPHTSHGGTILRFSKLRGETLLALQQPVEAEAALNAALTLARAQGVRPMQWRISLTLGKLYQSQGRHTEAKQLFVTARTIIEELATTIADEELRDTFLSQANRLLPRAHRL